MGNQNGTTLKPNQAERAKAEYVQYGHDFTAFLNAMRAKHQLTTTEDFCLIMQVMGQMMGQMMPIGRHQGVINLMVKNLREGIAATKATTQ